MVKQEHNDDIIIEINREQHYKQSSDFTSLIVSELNLMGRNSSTRIKWQQK